MNGSKTSLKTIFDLFCVPGIEKVEGSIPRHWTVVKSFSESEFLPAVRFFKDLRASKVLSRMVIYSRAKDGPQLSFLETKE